MAPSRVERVFGLTARAAPSMAIAAVLALVVGCTGTSAVRPAAAHDPVASAATTTPYARATLGSAPAGNSIGRAAPGTTSYSPAPATPRTVATSTARSAATHAARTTTAGAPQAAPRTTGASRPAAPITAAPVATRTSTRSTPSATRATDRVVTAEILAAVNAFRTQAGVPAVEETTCADTSALLHSESQAAAGSMYHRTLGQIEAACAMVGGENIAFGYPTAAAALAGWWASPEHRANILDGRYRIMGVAVAYAAGGTPYYTQVFYIP